MTFLSASAVLCFVHIMPSKSACHFEHASILLFLKLRHRTLMFVDTATTLPDIKKWHYK